MNVISELTTVLTGGVSDLTDLINIIIVLSAIVAVGLLVLPDTLVGRISDEAKSVFVKCIFGLVILKIVTGI